MDLIEEIDIDRIRNGDSGPLSMIFQQCYDKSLTTVRSVMRCSKEDAEDVLMDSIVSLRDAIVADVYRNENVGAYLTTVAINKLKNKKKKDYRIEFLMEEKLIVRGGATAEGEVHHSSKAEHIILCINELAGKCRSLLTRNLVDGTPLSALVTELEYSSYDVVKTSKSRCMHKLRVIIKEHSLNLKL